MTQTAILLDIDGTLVDTNYYHAVSWYRAFQKHHVEVPVWRLHRHIGMGGDQFISAVAGEQVESQQGDDIRDAHSEAYMAVIEEVRPLPGAKRFLQQLADDGRTVVLASSAKAEEVDHYLDLLDARELVTGWTTAADVESTKPEPDLIESARAKTGAGPAVLVGDSVWDCRAAAKASVPTVGVLTGGFAASELTEAGARSVVESVEALLEPAHRGKLD